MKSIVGHDHGLVFYVVELVMGSVAIPHLKYENVYVLIVIV